MDQGIQDAHDVREARPLGAVLVPAVQHELVQGTWATHGRWEPIALLHRADDLGEDTVPGLRLRSLWRTHSCTPTLGPRLTS